MSLLTSHSLCCDCCKPIVGSDDEAGVCIECGGRNRRLPPDSVHLTTKAQRMMQRILFKSARVLPDPQQPTLAPGPDERNSKS